MSPVSCLHHMFVVPLLGPIQPPPIALELSCDGLAHFYFFFLDLACGNQQSLGRRFLRS